MSVELTTFVYMWRYVLRRYVGGGASDDPGPSRRGEERLIQKLSLASDVPEASALKFCSTYSFDF